LQTIETESENTSPHQLADHGALSVFCLFVRWKDWTWPIACERRTLGWVH